MEKAHAARVRQHKGRPHCVAPLTVSRYLFAIFECVHFLSTKKAYLCKIIFVNMRTII